MLVLKFEVRHDSRRGSHVKGQGPQEAETSVHSLTHLGQAVLTKTWESSLRWGTTGELLALEQGELQHGKMAPAAHVLWESLSFSFLLFFFFFFSWINKVSLREEPEKDFGMMLVLPGLGKQANSLTGSWLFNHIFSIWEKIFQGG